LTGRLLGSSVERMIIRSLRIAALTSRVLASTAAAAAGPVVTASLTSDIPSAASGANIGFEGNGAFPAGLPTSLSLKLQPGFASSVKSVTTLCTASAGASGTCPSASRIGTGAILAGSSFGNLAIPLTLSLGAPSQAGDISTVFLYGSIDGLDLAAAARVFTPSGGGLELLISKFPSLPAQYAAFRPTIHSISFNARAVRTVKTKKTTYTGKGKHRKKHTKTLTKTYSFLTNPSSCPAAGAWSGTAALTFASGQSTLPVSAPCTT
jgi:hypothetical protein